MNPPLAIRVFCRRLVRCLRRAVVGVGPHCCPPLDIRRLQFTQMRRIHYSLNAGSCILLSIVASPPSNRCVRDWNHQDSALMKSIRLLSCKVIEFQTKTSRLNPSHSRRISSPLQHYRHCHRRQTIRFFLPIASSRLLCLYVLH
jgi:hypothetical protein